jgi:hypothetical protein
MVSTLQQHHDKLLAKELETKFDASDTETSSQTTSGSDERQDADGNDLSCEDVKYIRKLLLEARPAPPPPPPPAAPVTTNTSLDDSNPFSFDHEIQYTYKDHRHEMVDMQEAFDVPPPNGKNLRTVTELLEGSDALPPWLRKMLVGASKKVKRPAHKRKRNNAEYKDNDNEGDFGVLPSLFHCNFGVDSVYDQSEAMEEGSLMSSFSDLSDTRDEATDSCGLFTLYLTGIRLRNDT